MGMEVRAGGEGAGLAGRAWKCLGGLGRGLDAGTDAGTDASLVPKVSLVLRCRVAALLLPGAVVCCGPWAVSGPLWRGGCRG